MRVLALVPSLHNTSPGQRFRIEQWARYLERDGFEFTFASFEDEELHQVIYQPGDYAKKATLILCALARRLDLISKVRYYDAVFLYREAAMIGPAVIERLLAHRHIPVIFDFDDPIWLPYRSPTNGLLSLLKWQPKTAAICRLATKVVVGNRLLADYARRYNSNVLIVPTTIDLQRYPVKKSVANVGVVTLGWTGSHSTLPFLSLIHDPLRALAERFPFRLIVISSACSYRVERLPVEVVCRRWRPESEAGDLRDIDIGLAPFPCTGWTPWRCHGKVLQYMAAGLPVVASPVGIVSDYVHDGINGYLAQGPDEWVKRLGELIDNSELRRRMGQAGRRVVEERYAAAIWAPKLRDVFIEAASLRRSTTG